MHLVRGETEDTLESITELTRKGGEDRCRRDVWGSVFALGRAEVPSDTYSPPILKI